MRLVVEYYCRKCRSIINPLLVWKDAMEQTYHVEKDVKHTVTRKEVEEKDAGNAQRQQNDDATASTENSETVEAEVAELGDDQLRDQKIKEILDDSEESRSGARSSSHT